MSAGRQPSCRSCASAALITILSLGRTPLANSLLAAEQLDRPEPTYPLELVFCPACALAQITETIPPERLFREYVYFSSFSDTMLSHAQKLAETIIEQRSLGPDSLVVEAASNDGYLLRFYKEHGVGVLGIEPALNVARVAEENGIPTLAEFFDPSVAAQLARRAHVFHAHNVLAHVADLNGFVHGISVVLSEDGVAVIEVPYLKDMLDRCEFDTIYHEHLCYFSVTSLARLFEAHGLVLADVERVPIHGGSLPVSVEHAGNGRPVEAAQSLLEEEKSWGVGEREVYEDFARRVRELETSILDLLRSLRANGCRLAAYGAAAKGSTLLNVLRIGTETLEFVVDRSTAKQGLYMPGVHLAIEPPERLLEEMPDYVLILAWNLADEIIAQQEEYRRRGGRFIIPIPEPKVI